MKRTLEYGTLIGVAAILLVSVPHQTQRAAGQPQPKSAVPPKPQARENPLLVKGRQGELTMAMLVDGLGSVDTQERHQAIDAIVGLRNHYLDVARQVARFNSDAKSRGLAQNQALHVLGYVRPFEASVVKQAAQDISFILPLRDGSYSGGSIDDYAAADVLTRASLAALPALADLIAKAPLPKQKQALTKEFLPLGRTLSILGPATLPWLQYNAALTREPARKKAFLQAAAFITKASTADAAAFSATPFMTIKSFIRPEILEGGYDPSSFKRIDLKGYKIEWDVAGKLANELKTGTSRPSPAGFSDQKVQTRITSDEMTSALALLQYGILKRLESSASREANGFLPYPAEAQTDAVRVLVGLRSDMGLWVIWGRLRNLSLHHPVDEDKSEDTSACLRALGQIDIPAARMLADRAASEWAENQQRAATFALERVMNFYQLICVSLKAKPGQKLRLEWLQKLLF